MAAAPTTALIYIACSGSSHHMGGFHPSIVISPTTLTSGRHQVCAFQIVGTSSGWALAYQGPVFLDTDVQLLGLISLGETVVPANSFLEFFASVPAVPSGVHAKSWSPMHWVFAQLQNLDEYGYLLAAVETDFKKFSSRISLWRSSLIEGSQAGAVPSRNIRSYSGRPEDVI